MHTHRPPEPITVKVLIVVLHVKQFVAEPEQVKHFASHCGQTALVPSSKYPSTHKQKLDILEFVYLLSKAKQLSHKELLVHVKQVL